MPQFTRRPAPVQARQFDGTEAGARDLARWCNGREILLPGAGNGPIRAIALWTPMATHRALPGDWIVREAPCRYVVVPADEFAATYQPVEE